MKTSMILRGLRKENGMTQRELAKKISCGYSAVAMWENGSRMPSRQNTETLAGLYNVDIDYLYGRSPDRQRIHFYRDGHMMARSDIVLSPFEQDLVKAYRAADPGTQSSIRKFLDLPSDGARVKRDA